MLAIFVFFRKTKQNKMQETEFIFPADCSDWLGSMVRTRTRLVKQPFYWQLILLLRKVFLNYISILQVGHFSEVNYVWAIQIVTYKLND